MIRDEPNQWSWYEGGESLDERERVQPYVRGAVGNQWELHLMHPVGLIPL